jgi:type IV secretory pathway component VirB8
MTQKAKDPQDPKLEAAPEGEYFDFIKKSVADKSYFKDAFNWYSFRYVTPVCDRTLLIFGSIIASVVLFCLIQMIESTFPLVEQVPVFIKAKDQSEYLPQIVDLKPKKNTPGFDPEMKTVDEAIAKYLLTFYVVNREGYDFSEAEVEDVNKKFNYVKNSSSAAIFKDFLAIMDKNNPQSPINFFGQDVVKKIDIISLKFIREERKDLSYKVMNFFSNKIPTSAEIRFLATTTDASEEGLAKQVKENYLAKISFVFLGANKGEKGSLKFAVNSYKLFKIK